MTLNCSRRVTQGTVKNSLFLFVAFMKGLSFRDFVAQCDTGPFRLSPAQCFVQLLTSKEKGREMCTLPSRRVFTSNMALGVVCQLSYESM